MVDRSLNRLSATAVAKLKKPGMHADGGGLYLLIRGAQRSWVFRFRDGARLRDMGLGPAHTVSLADAREQATAARRQRLDGVDPIEARATVRAAAKAEKAATMTFRSAADAYIAAHRAGWRNEKHAEQWSSTLAAYAHPTIGDLSVSAVDTTLVLKILRPIWATKTETASRVRGRIESILDWAKVSGLRAGENPARWRGHLDHMLPARAKVRPVEHFAALPYAELAGFMTALRAREGIAARCLEFTILTAARSGEARGATWAEVDVAAAVWTVPAARTKARREHRVPLSDRALAILEEMRLTREVGPLVFPGHRLTQPLSDMSLTAVLGRMGRDITVHGFRSTFTDWAREQASFDQEVRKAALAHTIDDKTDAAYARGDMFEKRRKLMAAWADYAARSTASPVAC